jgi:hypothetical protein
MNYLYELILNVYDITREAFAAPQLFTMKSNIYEIKFLKHYSIIYVKNLITRLPGALLQLHGLENSWQMIDNN